MHPLLARVISKSSSFQTGATLLSTVSLKQIQSRYLITEWQEMKYELREILVKVTKSKHDDKLTVILQTFLCKSREDSVLLLDEL